MENQIESLLGILSTVLAALLIVAAALLLYSLYLIGVVLRLVRRLPRRPQVERDGTGRRIKERL